MKFEFDIFTIHQKKKNTLQKENETGRSMVEMLGVLAIIGILSVMGITGYKMALTMHEQNEIINEVDKRAIVISQQRAVGSKISISELPEKIHDKYTTKVRTSPNVDDQDWFAIDVENVPEDLCKSLIKTDWKIPFDIEIDSGDGFISIYDGSHCKAKGDSSVSFIFWNDLNTQSEEEKHNCGPGQEWSDEFQECHKNCGEGFWDGNDCIMACPEGQVLSYKHCCPATTYWNGKTCADDCWKKGGVGLDNIINGDNSFFDKCKKTCPEGQYYAMYNVTCDGVQGKGQCATLPDFITVKERIYSKEFDERGARQMNLLDEAGQPILLGEEKAMQLTKNTKMFLGCTTSFLEAGAVCASKGMHMPSISELKCGDRLNKSGNGVCTQDGKGSEIVQALMAVYLAKAEGYMPFWVTGTRNNCIPGHLWIDWGQLNYMGGTSFDANAQAYCSYIMCFK